MTKEMKRPTSHISGNSIKPALSKAVEFYTDNNIQAYECIRERDDYIDYLERKLNNASQQQALPVVPECVDLFIKECREFNYDLDQAFYEQEDGSEATENNKCILWRRNHPDEFARAWLDGYTVEKPQLFYLREKNTGYYLRKTGNNEYGITPHYSNDYDEKYTHYKFTKSEIDSMETGSYEQIEVAE